MQRAAHMHHLVREDHMINCMANHSFSLTQSKHMYRNAIADFTVFEWINNKCMLSQCKYCIIANIFVVP